MTDHKLAHLVFFSLADKSPESVNAHVEACHKYLNNHDGVTYFAAGVLGTEFEREVNDQDFDVSCQVVFESREAHDAYQTAERHLQFIPENKDKWTNVRIFDTWVR